MAAIFKITPTWRSYRWDEVGVAFPPRLLEVSRARPALTSIK